MEKKPLFSITKEDFEIQTFRSGGPGGQNQNRVSSGVRIIHRDSGAVGESRSDRSQLINKRLAFKHLVASKKFQVWLKLEQAYRITGKTVEQVVEEQMAPKNLRVDVMGPDGKWVLESDQTRTSTIETGD